MVARPEKGGGPHQRKLSWDPGGGWPLVGLLDPAGHTTQPPFVCRAGSRSRLALKRSREVSLVQPEGHPLLSRGCPSARRRRVEGSVEGSRRFSSRAGGTLLPWPVPPASSTIGSSATNAPNGCTTSTTRPPTLRSSTRSSPPAKAPPSVPTPSPKPATATTSWPRPRQSPRPGVRYEDLAGT